MKKEELFRSIQGKMIVSCQAVYGEPLYVEEKSVMYLMARAAKMAGSPAIRTSGIRDILAIKEETGLPVIGLIKKQYEGYEGYITPTMREVDALMRADTDVVAVDCTLRKRGDGKTVNQYLAEIRQKYPDIILMADIATFDEGINAWQCGVDMVSTTMSGYTTDSPNHDGPDYKLMRKLVETIDIPVIGEGRIHSPQQAVEALNTGVWAIVVGSAITRPLEIAQRFVKAIENREA